MFSFDQVNTAAIILKLKLINKFTKIIWFITKIPKGQDNILFNYSKQSNHKLIILLCSKTPELYSHFKKLTSPHSTIDMLNKFFLMKTNKVHKTLENFFVCHNLSIYKKPKS